MTQPSKQAMMQADIKATFHLLKNAFPHLQKVPLRQSITSSPFLAPLAKRLQLNIPIDAYPSQCISLYQQINDEYLRHALNLHPAQTTAPAQTHVDEESRMENEENERSQEGRRREVDGSSRRCKMSFVQLASFIAEFKPQQEYRVSSELIEMGRVFQSWQTDQTSTILTPRPVLNKKEQKPQSADIKYARQRSQKTDDLKIVFGKNISLQCKAMRHQILSRAQNNKLLQSNNSLTEVEKKEIQINFILNRITQEYFQDFKQQLKPFAQNQLYSFTLSQKIIEKAMEEHNYIKIYSKLVKTLKNEAVSFETDKFVLFKHIFVQNLQSIFYNIVQKGEWLDNQQLNKKHLLGLSLFISELFNNRMLSKNIFPDIFYQLVHRYVIEYKGNVNGKNYYFETYIECIVKIIQKMETYYNELIQNSNTSDLQKVVRDILDINNPTDYNFEHRCDYVEVLKEINTRLPSQRFKITFLLQDFRCSKAINKPLNNTEAQIIKSILAIDISQHQDVEKIPTMIQRANLSVLMKDFFLQFSEGNIKQVNKHIEIFKLMTRNPLISDATIISFKANIEDIYLIQSDFPYLTSGIARIIRIVCDLKKMDFYGLDLGQDSHPDQDIRQFLQNVQGKYFKMAMED